MVIEWSTITPTSLTPSVQLVFNLRSLSPNLCGRSVPVDLSGRHQPKRQVQPKESEITTIPSKVVDDRQEEENHQRHPGLSSVLLRSGTCQKLHIRSLPLILRECSSAVTESLSEYPCHLCCACGNSNGRWRRRQWTGMVINPFG